jgi:hypothetical protein
MNEATIKVTSLCGCAWEARVDPDTLLDTTVRVDLVCPTHGKLGVRLELTSPANVDLLTACKVARECLLNGSPPGVPLLATEAAIAKAEGGTP